MFDTTFELCTNNYIPILVTFCCKVQSADKQNTLLYLVGGGNRHLAILMFCLIKMLCNLEITSDAWRSIISLHSLISLYLWIINKYQHQIEM